MTMCGTVPSGVEYGRDSTLDTNTIPSLGPGITIPKGGKTKKPEHSPAIV